MSMSMGPPQLPAYSLRVQLFSPIAHASTDRPIRCFRVVTSPELTIREFCEEASRIHEINYGQPLTIKKCQDDQEFDVTQSEIIGYLFQNTATIRIIQASAQPGVRDSVPPSSALRFDPANGTSRKRGRESSVLVNGSARSSSWKPNKRQKLPTLDTLDPDDPLPSRESESDIEATANGHVPDINIIPSSQESVILGNHADDYNSRNVRDNPLQIPGTPSPSPPPEIQNSRFETPSSNAQNRKSTTSKRDLRSTLPLEIAESSPLRAATTQVQSHILSSARAKSASYHIQRATERGTSVSTAATSPLSGDQQGPGNNKAAAGSKLLGSDSGSIQSKQNGQDSRLRNKDGLYEHVPSDDESAAILNVKRAKLKIKNSPKSGLLGLEMGNKRFNTPPVGAFRTSKSHEPPSTTPDELPLTPNSKERVERQRQSEEADEAKRARLAAARAVEERKREADRVRIAKEERSKREEQEKLDIEDFRREEAAKATRLQKKREEKEMQEAKERRRKEEEEKQERIARKEERVAREKEEVEPLEREQAQAEEARRLLETEERNRASEAAAVEGTKILKEGEAPKRQSMSSSPAPGTTPSRRQQSSTPFIPNGRKSALKTSLASSQVVGSSPPVTKHLSPEAAFKGVGLDAQMPLPKGINRRVSFDEENLRQMTPIKPPTKILPPGRGTPKPSQPPLKVAQSTPKVAGKSSAILPPKQSYTPIPLPPSIRRLSAERSATPVVPPKKILPQKEATPIPAHNKVSLVPQPVPRDGTPVQPPAIEKSKSVGPPTKLQPEAEISSDDGSDEDIPSRVGPAKASTNTNTLRPHSISPVRKTAPEPQSENGDDEEEDEDDDAASKQSSGRDSRSPVVFSQHPLESTQLARSALPESSDDSEEDSTSGDESEEESDVAEQDDDEESDDENEDDDDESESNQNKDEPSKIQVPKSSPPTLPPLKPSRLSDLNQAKSKGLSPEDVSIQEEIDQQLTSSLYEVLPPVKSSSLKVVPSSSIARPTLKFGASLSSLNLKKPVFGSSRLSNGINGTQSSQAVLRDASDSEEEESEDESSDDSDSSDEDGPLKAILPHPVTPKNPVKQSKDTDTDSDDSSDSDSEKQDEAAKLREELAAQIAGMGGSTQSQNSLPSLSSPKALSNTQDTKSSEKKKKKDKWVSGYTFSQPV